MDHVADLFRYTDKTGVIRRSSMSEAPTVSVLMTAYNRAKYIGMAIESVLASTFRDFELVVVDDGSTDGTQDIVKGFATRDSRIRFHQNETNLGDYPNRNRAASLARGKWLKYVDADDYIYPHGLEVLVSTMAKFPDAGYGLCCFQQLREQPYPLCLSPQEAYRCHYFEKTVSPQIFNRAPLASIIAKSAWEAVGGFSLKRMTGDTDMWHRLSKQFSVVLMQGGVVWYRVHDQQESSELATDSDFWGPRYQQITLRALHDPDVPLTSAERAQIARRMSRGNRRRAAKLLFRGRLRDSRAYFRKAEEFALLTDAT
jgi:glycosyltransferase involved in cell wall biosynthesis